MIDVFVGTRAAFEVHCRSVFGMRASAAEKAGRAIHFHGIRDTAGREGPGRLVVGHLASLDTIRAAEHEITLMNLRSNP